MGSLARGESSSASNPVLDIYTAIGGPPNPPVPTDVYSVGFRILDISTPAKKGAPVQVYPAGIGTIQPINVVDAPPTGQRLGVGHYFAPWTVPLDQPIGDHKIEWEFKLHELTPAETLSEEFFVSAGSGASAFGTYCGVSDLRGEGFIDPVLYPDSRIEMLAELATRYIDKVTRRWFGARVFTEENQFRLDGKNGYRVGQVIAGGSRTLHLPIPIIRLDRLLIETQGLVDPDPTEIDLSAVRVYNRHITGQTRPDDRENPRLDFVQSRIIETLSSGLFSSPRLFVAGSQNIIMEGVFGYTEPDGSAFGRIPALIRQAACRLVARDLLLDADHCEKLIFKNKFRIISDKEGSTTIRLQDLWLRGGLTGDPDIDNILTMFRAPAEIGVA